MAKQHTLVNLTGKVGELSYYYTRNGGFQMRRNNPNMSDRVKTEPGFQNTRLNANEFGAAAGFASVWLRNISQRWRLVLMPSVKGYLTGNARKAIEMDAVSAFGRRTIVSAAKPVFLQGVNTIFKNQLPAHASVWLNSEIKFENGEDFTLVSSALKFTQEQQAHYLFAGATHLKVELWRFRYFTPVFNAQSNKYIIQEPVVEHLQNTDNTVALSSQSPITAVQAGVRNTHWASVDDNGDMRPILMIIYPIKQVNGASYILQKYVEAGFSGQYEYGSYD